VATATLTITTTASIAQSLPSHPQQSHPIYAVWIQLQGIGLLGVVLAAPWRRGRKLSTLVPLAFLAAILISMTGCAGGTGIAPTAPPPQAGTTPGTYTITLTGAAGGLQHSLPVTLVVQ